jgi:hypothetical protein
MMITIRFSLTIILVVVLISTVGFAQTSIKIPEFKKSTQIFAPMGTFQITLADLDADGDLDAVFSNMRSSSRILLNDGLGSFQFSELSLPHELHGIAIGDVDLDGDPDLFFAPIRDNHAHSPLYLNNGAGKFEEGNIDISSADFSGIGVRLIDLESDGDLDALIQQSRKFTRLTNDGKGNFSLSSNTYPDMSEFCDLNTDGFIDIFAREVGRGFRVYLNDKAGEFTEYSFFEKKNALRSRTFFADVDNDSDPDAICTNGEGAVYPARILINDGTGKFTESDQTLPSVDVSRVGAGDLNGDGWVDLVFTDWDKPCQAWLNDGAGKFEDSGIRFTVDGGISGCVIADVDNDGDNDVFIASYSGGNNALWFNQLIENKHK